MGKVLKVVAIVVAVAVVVFAPYVGLPLLAGIGITGLAASAILATAVIGASVALRALTAGKPSSTSGANATPTVFRQSISNSFIVYGRRRVGGLLVFYHARKAGSAHYRYFTIAVAGHHCQGNVAWMLGDEEVTVDGAGKVTSGAYADAAWLWFQSGAASETANATFVAECGGKWTSAHKGNGIAAIYAKFQMTDAAVQAGMPNITAIIDGKDDIVDPRDDSTGYSNNAALVFYDWMKLPREEGGFGAYDDEIPDDDWISAQANVCDEEVEGEARYALDGVITTGAAPSEVRDSLVVSCAGSYTFSEGKHLMRVGYWVAPTQTLQEADLAGGIKVSPFMTGDTAANEVQGTFIDPGAGYQPAPFATRTADPAPTDIRQLDLDLAFITSKYRAERIANIMLGRAQCEKSVTWPMNIAGLATGALDVVQLATDRYGLSNYAWVVASWNLSADFGVVLTLREENEDIYADPEPVTPDSIPAIAKGEEVLTTRQITNAITDSTTRPTRVLEATESGGSATIKVIEHERIYPDGTSVTIEEQIFTGLVTDTPYYPYYVDLSMSDTAPTIVMTTDSGEAQLIPGAHALGRSRTPIAASGITYLGGGSYPGGAPIGREIEGPTP